MVTLVPSRLKSRLFWWEYSWLSDSDTLSHYQIPILSLFMVYWTVPIGTFGFSHSDTY